MFAIMVDFAFGVPSLGLLVHISQNGLQVNSLPLLTWAYPIGLLQDVFAAGIVEDGRG